MSIKKLNPYLNFNGTAAKAIELYERVLGAKVENMMRFGDMPGGTSAADTKDRVMHAVLKLGEQVVMLSDGRPDMLIPSESNQHLCLDFDDADDMARKFDALAAGGKVTMPLADTFWGAKFGMLTDAYNVQWMFNCEMRKG
jgi:PhnB protein